MLRTFFTTLLVCVTINAPTYAAQEIRLRLQPTMEAPVVARVIASDQVILNTAPAPRNAQLGWRKISLPTPFEGYVDIESLGKNFAILEGSPVHYLPTVESGVITKVEEGDIYEVVSVTETWATVRYRKDIIGYFNDEVAQSAAVDSEPPQLPLVSTEPAPAPIAIPARPFQINPDQPIAQLDPTTLPAENVIWKPVRVRGGDPSSLHSAVTESESESSPTSRIASPASPASPISDLMVTQELTQAREATRDLGPAKTPRLLTGTLEREINVDGPTYPIRLKSPEGRLIAYVDFSGIYISDLSPFIGQKVYIRGQIYPLPNTRAQLVILADSLRLAE